MSPRQPTSRELIAAIQPAKEMATKLTRRVGRFEIYELLEAIYRVYIDWKRRKTAKRSAHALADQLDDGFHGTSFHGTMIWLADSSFSAG